MSSSPFGKLVLFLIVGFVLYKVADSILWLKMADLALEAKKSQRATPPNVRNDKAQFKHLEPIIEEVTIGQGKAASVGSVVKYRFKILSAGNLNVRDLRNAEHAGEHVLAEAANSPDLANHGLVGMAAGGKRRVTIPPDQFRGWGDIPAGVKFVFETEVFDVK